MIMFYDKVWKEMKKIPNGKVTTYKRLAERLDTKAYRSVGSACKNNHDSTVPCHRVVCSDGRIGGFNRGVKKKVDMLNKEGIEIRNGKIVDFDNVLW